MIKLVQGCWSRGFKRHPLLQTSSPLEHQPRTYIEIGTMNGGTSPPRKCLMKLLPGNRDRPGSTG
jgi:hypothetical protein